MYSRISCGLGMALNFSSHWRSAREDSAEKPESTGSSLDVECNHGNATVRPSNNTLAQMIRFIGSSDSLRNRLLRQNFAQHKISNQRETRPFPLIRLDRINNSENEVQDPSAHSPKPDQPEYTEKSQRRCLIRSIVRERDDRRKHENHRDDHAHKENQRAGGMPDQHLQRIKRHEPRIFLHEIKNQRRQKGGENWEHVDQQRHRPLVLGWNRQSSRRRRSGHELSFLDVEDRIVVG